MIWFIMGGLVVAVIVVAYFMMGDGVPAMDAAAPADEAAPDAAPAETTPEPAAPAE